MKERAYSYSQLRQFAECPLAWKLARIDRVKEEPSRPMMIGGAAHQAIEQYVVGCHASGLASDAALIDDIVDGLSCAEDLRGEVRMLLDKFAGSYEVRLTDPDLETRRAWRSDWTETHWTDWSRCRFRAVTDLVDKAGTVLEITDWKTGFRIPTREEFAEDLQLRAYAFVQSLLHPEAEEFHVRLYHVRIGYEQGPLIIHRDELDSVREELERRMAAVDLACVKGDFNPTPGDHCERCGYRRQCPAYLASGRAELPEETPALAVEYFTLKAKLKDVETALKDRVASEGPVLLGDGRQLGFVAQERVSIADVKAAIAALLSAGVGKDDVFRELTLSKTAAEKLLKRAGKRDIAQKFIDTYGEVSISNVFKSHQVNGGAA